MLFLNNIYKNPVIDRVFLFCYNSGTVNKQGHKLMSISAVGPAGASSARSALMEIWRMSMTQRAQLEMRERSTQPRPEKREKPRQVDPAVQILISPSAKLMGKIHGDRNA